MLYAGYDTDDLTNRQYFIFRKFANKGVSELAFNFLSYCIEKNYSLNEFSNYGGDCDFLSKVNPEILKKYGIDLSTLYE